MALFSVTHTHTPEPMPYVPRTEDRYSALVKIVFNQTLRYKPKVNILCHLYDQVKWGSGFFKMALVRMQEMVLCIGTLIFSEENMENVVRGCLWKGFSHWEGGEASQGRCLEHPGFLKIGAETSFFNPGVSVFQTKCFPELTETGLLPLYCEPW